MYVIRSILITFDPFYIFEYQKIKKNTRRYRCKQKKKKKPIISCCLLPCVLYFITIITATHIRTRNAKYALTSYIHQLDGSRLCYNAPKKKSMNIILLRSNILSSCTCRISLPPPRQGQIQLAIGNTECQSTKKIPYFLCMVIWLALFDENAWLRLFVFRRKKKT